MSKQILIEVCANSPESALAAEQGGAHRVELCDNLMEGGTTPSAGAILETRKRLNIDLNVIIRPRGGDFCYSDLEFAVMQEDIQRAKDWGVDGVVIGILNPDGSVDVDRCVQLINLARPLSVTFHRAFDMTSDPWKALDDCITMGVDRILTSGQKNKAIEGTDLIRDMVQHAGDHLIIMPGGGVNEYTIGDLIRYTQAKEFHASCQSTIQSPMTYRNPIVFMGGHPDITEYEKRVTDARRVNVLLQYENNNYK